MTFQVGMIAQDGILLASDRVRTEGPCLGRPATTVRVDKINLPPSKIAYCCAGDDLALALGKQIGDTIDSESSSDLGGFFSHCATQAMEQTSPHGSWYGGTVLVVCAGSQLWRIDLNKPNNSKSVQKVEEGFITSGDDSNYARFFLERYFPLYPRARLNSLVRLAAHTVMIAGGLNPSQIGGLEIVLCRRSVFKRYSPAQLNKLKDFSIELEKEMKEKFGLPSRRH